MPLTILKILMQRSFFRSATRRKPLIAKHFGCLSTHFATLREKLHALFSQISVILSWPALQPLKNRSGSAQLERSMFSQFIQWQQLVNWCSEKIPKLERSTAFPDPRLPNADKRLALIVWVALLACRAVSVTATEPLFDGLGNFGRKITTASPGAQRYFDQG